MMFTKTSLAASAIAVISMTASSAAQANCNVSGMKSPGSNEPTQFTVVNDIHDRSAKLYWIDFEGNKTLYATIPPNGVHQQQTYRGHIWISENSYGYCDIVWIAQNHAEIVIR